MSSTRKVLLGVAAIVVIVGWYAFRPERLFVDQEVNESFQESAARDASPAALLSGEFKSVAHETRGTATIYQDANGSRTLRLANFETSNGPDVRVYLVAAADARNDDDVKNAGFVELGALKGNVGDQNYNVPADLDLTKYRAVTIWCKRFSVNFGTAPLTSATAL